VQGSPTTRQSYNKAVLHAVRSRFADCTPKTHNVDAFVFIVDDIDDPPGRSSHPEQFGAVRLAGLPEPAGRSRPGCDHNIQVMFQGRKVGPGHCRAGRTLQVSGKVPDVLSCQGATTDFIPHETGQGDSGRTTPSNTFSSSSLGLPSRIASNSLRSMPDFST